MTRKFHFTKFGIAEDPRGAQVTWTINGRTFLADVVGCYFNNLTGATMLKVRAFCGEIYPDISASFVDVLVR